MMDDLQKINKMLEQGKITEAQVKILKEAFQESENRKQKIKIDMDQIKKQRKKEANQFTAYFFLLSLTLIVGAVFLTKTILSGTAIFFLIIFILLIVTTTWIVLLLFYNNLAGKEERVHQAWAHVEAEYQRRLDLIPALTQISQDYAEHEKQTFSEVTKARGKAKSVLEKVDLKYLSNKNELEGFEEAQSHLNLHLKQMSALAEKYPDLKSNVNFLTIQSQVEETENAVTYARQQFNQNVGDYNKSTRIFPANLIAALFNFKTKHYFKKG
jgi:LemA protein